jgi:hypothetical protein
MDNKEKVKQTNNGRHYTTQKTRDWAETPLQFGWTKVL